MSEVIPSRVPVVGIGASAGGVEAFRAFFEHMESDSGLGFVVILHLPAASRSLLPELLRGWTSMEVVAAADGCLVEANRIYVPPPGQPVRLHNGRLHSHPAVVGTARESHPIDIFFDSLALDLEEDAIGIVLSGTGNDGALGLTAIKAAGGLTCAQGTDGSAPSQFGMPTSAIATGAVDIVASVEEMPPQLLQSHRARHASRDAGDLPIGETDALRRAICTELSQQTGHDFSAYKTRTFLRRVQRRMDALGIANLADYHARIATDRAEGAILLRELLVSVTSFFRDTDTFDAVAKTVLPLLFQGKGPSDTVRVWVPGCATGEEAYTLGILFLEFIGADGSQAPKIQILATDIDEAAIATARAGRYKLALLQGMDKRRRSRFFAAGTDDTYTVTKALRDLCTFSAHSLVRDPPFSRLNMVSCRNILIYMDSELQALVIPAFHYALLPRGILLLGSSETVSRHEDLFTGLDRRRRIFQRRDVPSPPLPMGGKLARTAGISGEFGLISTANGSRAMISKLTERASARILQQFTPAFVVVREDGAILLFSSRTGRFLEASAGAPTQNALDMVRLALRSHLRSALKNAAATGKTVECPPVAVDIPGYGRQRIGLVVEPLVEQGADVSFLVVFAEAADQEAGAGDVAADENVDLASERQLESELRDTREQLQSITEEHLTALEELRSANEELHSVNEELQSTNEELETSREEIQSVNEELQTVNNQLAVKVDELDGKNNDLKNLFDSTEVATVFLDPYFVIRSFTPAIGSLYNLIPSDIGRPITDIVTKLGYRGLQEDVRHVLNTLEPLEMRVSSHDDQTHYLMRILPYRTPASKVDGTLVTFVDVTVIVQAEQHQRLLVDELNHRVKNMLTAVISLYHQTVRRAGSLDDFTSRYMGRLNALNAAYSLVSEKVWQTVALRDTLTEELKPFMTGSNVNVSLHGPHVMLPPRAALALSMAVHELTTNAVKYGALSAAEGRVSVVWEVAPSAQGDALHMDWVESGGPAVVPPVQRGFGLTLIERGLKQDMSATVEVEFATTGVIARIKTLMGADTGLQDASGSYHAANS